MIVAATTATKTPEILGAIRLRTRITNKQDNPIASAVVLVLPS